jgi:1-acyl-sn-glycerol-3-phosphate acyltransferase
MRRLWCWAVSLFILLRYALYRAGIGRRPNFTDHWDRVEVVYRQITRMDPRIRVREAARCPKSHPAVYVGNHTKLDDPFFVCYAVQEASGYTMHTRFVMRDDFFEGFPWNWLPIRMNEIAEMGGSYNISQKSATLAQLKPLVDMLLAPDSFVIFPGGGRSTSGHWLESHVGEEPGSIAFFLAQAQRRNPDVAVPAVPVGRTYNPVKRVSAVIVGEPRCLAPGARRDAQRTFDDALFTDLSDLVELHALHLLCGILYLRVRHGMTGPVGVPELAAACRSILSAVPGRYVDPALPGAIDGDLSGAIRYLTKYGMLRFEGGAVKPNVGAILTVPPTSTRFRFENPVQFHVNQIVHLADVTTALESVVIGE